MKPIRILAAGKDTELLSLVETRLKVRNYEVFLATQSDDVVPLAQKICFDLALISTSIDREGHAGLCRRVKQASANFNLPVILVAKNEDIRDLVLSPEHGFDDFLIEPFDVFALTLRVELNLIRARERLQANPLTHLPGTIAVAEHVKRQIEKGETFSVCYLDINHFKSFNDRYGFERGDAVIKHTGRLISRCLANLGAASQPASRQVGAVPLHSDSFMGHIGGDDFIVVLSSDQEADFARLCLHEFDRIIPTYYDEADRKKGSIFVKNRSGVPCSFPLMSLSLAAVSNKQYRYANLAEIARVAAEVKTFLKTQPGSHYLRDRRTEPLRTLEEILEVFENAKITQDQSKPLGQLLLGIGLITDHELDLAVRRHVETGERLGQVLIRMNVATSGDIGRCLAEKLGVEYVSLQDYVLDEALLDLVPWAFIKKYQAVPIELKSGMLILAMVDPLNQNTIQEMKEISALPVRAKLTLENEFEEFVERQRRAVISDESF